jgi:protein TonB
MTSPVASVDQPTVAPRSDAPLHRQEMLHWTACAIVALTAHVGVALALAWRWDKPSAEAGPSVVMVEFAPVAATPPAPPTELPPGPPQIEAQAPQQVHPEAETGPPDEPRQEQATAAETPTVAPPTPPPEPVKEPTETKLEPQVTEATRMAAAPPSVEIEANQAAGPPIGATSKAVSAAIATWQRVMLDRVQRFHRYPARAHNESGIAGVEFAIDRTGRVLSSRIVKSSGYAMLDQDALALIRRASPFPSPPASVSDDLLTIVLPVRYDAAAR